MEHCVKLFIEYYNIYFYKSGLLQYIVPIKSQFNHLEYCPNNPPLPFSVFRPFSSQKSFWIYKFCPTGVSEMQSCDTLNIFFRKFISIKYI